MFFSISDLIEMSDVNHVNILFAMAVKLMEAAEERHIRIGSKTKKAFISGLVNILEQREVQLILALS